MTLWIAWSMLVSAVVGVAAAALERVASYVGIGRRFVWIVAMAGVIVLPVVLALRVAPTATRAPVLDSKAAGALTGQLTGVRDARVDRPSILTSVLLAATDRRADRWLVRGWLGASTVLLLLFLRAAIALRRRRAQWRDAENDTGDRLLVSPNDGPAVVGFVRPRIVLPAWALTVDRTTRDLLLRHEREHVRAGDMLLLLVGELARIAFPWNAALWWMERRLRLAIELDCDARVVRAVGAPHAYGLLLLAVGERHASVLPLATSLSEPRSNLEARITAMMSSRPRRPLVASLPFAAIALAFLTMVAWAPQPPSLRQHAEGPKPLRGNAAPRYPDSLRAAGTEGRVIVSLSIDARGVPDTSTIAVIESSHPLFVSAVRAVLASWRFDSAGSLRLSFRFMTTATEERERAGQPVPTRPSFDGELPVVIVVMRPPESD